VNKAIASYLVLIYHTSIRCLRGLCSCHNYF